MGLSWAAAPELVAVAGWARRSDAEVERRRAWTLAVLAARLTESADETIARMLGGKLGTVSDDGTEATKKEGSEK